MGVVIETQVKEKSGCGSGKDIKVVMMVAMHYTRGERLVASVQVPRALESAPLPFFVPLTFNTHLLNHPLPYTTLVHMLFPSTDSTEHD